jgi:hypothetical protein
MAKKLKNIKKQVVAALIIGFGCMVFSCVSRDEIYPPGGKRIVNVTRSDPAAGSDDYRRFIGGRFRVLMPTLAVCDALKVTRKSAPDEINLRTWLDRFVTVRDIHHLRIHFQAGDNGYFTDYIHCVLETDSEKQGHWFAMLSFPDRFPEKLPRTPVSDAFQAFFASGPFPQAGAEIPGSFNDIGVGAASEAPRLETAHGEERAAPERLIALLEQSPAKGIMEASLYVKQYRFHEVARAVAAAVGALPPDEPGAPPARQSAARVLGEIGDPLAVDALIQMLGDDNPFVRTAAAGALAQIGSWQALPVMEDRLVSLRKPTVEPAPSPGGAIVEIIFFRQERWESSLALLGAMVEIIARQGAPLAADEETNIARAVGEGFSGPEDLLAAAAFSYRKSIDPTLIDGEKVAWLRASVNAMDALVVNYPDDPVVPALRRVLFYISQVRGIRPSNCLA